MKKHDGILIVRFSFIDVNRVRKEEKKYRYK